MEENFEPIPTKNVVDINPKMSEEWTHYKRLIEMRKPSVEELQSRWYRKRLHFFVQKYFNKFNKIPPKPMGTEEHFFSLYPKLESKWTEEKNRLKIFLPSDRLLRERWLESRKFEFEKRWLKENTSLIKDNIKEEKNIRAEEYSLCHSRINSRFWLKSINNISALVLLTLICIYLYVKQV
jgi:hypothetical protein